MSQENFRGVSGGLWKIQCVSKGLIGARVGVSCGFKRDQGRFRGCHPGVSSGLRGDKRGPWKVQERFREILGTFQSVSGSAFQGVSEFRRVSGGY